MHACCGRAALRGEGGVRRAISGRRPGVCRAISGRQLVHRSRCGPQKDDGRALRHGRPGGGKGGEVTGNLLGREGRGPREEQTPPRAEPEVGQEVEAEVTEGRGRTWSDGGTWWSASTGRRRAR